MVVWPSFCSPYTIENHHYKSQWLYAGNPSYSAIAVAISKFGLEIVEIDVDAMDFCLGTQIDDYVVTGLVGWEISQKWCRI